MYGQAKESFVISVLIAWGHHLFVRVMAVVLCSVLALPVSARVDSVIGADQFRGLVVALRHYQKLARSGQWVPLPNEPAVTTEEKFRERALLVNLLVLSGDLGAVQQRVRLIDVSESDLYRALVRFQRRHGLDADGYLGRDTRRALNISPYRKAEVVAANLMRLQRLPMWPGERYLVVNVGDFRLDLIEDSRSVLSMKVIAGRPARPTPIHSDRVSQVVVNPPWNVPLKLQQKDILPKLRKNPEYLRENNYVLIQYLPEGRRELALDHARLEQYTWNNQEIQAFPFHLRQKPGDRNSLGRYKFDFPNRHAVYLHDTPTKKLFNPSIRAFSSGCVRVEKPRQLAEALLSFNPGWQPEDIDDWLAQGETRYISLRRPVPVHLVYQTAWVDLEGALQFRADLYGRDRAPDNFSMLWQPEHHLLLGQGAFTPQG